MICLVGNGRVYTSIREDEKESVEHMDVERGDVSVVEKGSVFYLQSRPSPTEESLQIHVIFNTVDEGNSEVYIISIYLYAIVSFEYLFHHALGVPFKS